VLPKHTKRITLYLGKGARLRMKVQLHTLASFLFLLCLPACFGVQSKTNNCQAAAVGSNCTIPVIQYSVSSTVDGGFSSILPSGAQTVVSGSVQTYNFTFVSAGIVASPTIGGTCPAGTWSNGGLTYTTGAITANCSLSFTSGYPVTVTSDSNETLSPSSSTVVVSPGGTLPIQATPLSGYSLTIGGTCLSGSWSGNTYTTGTISSACSLSFTGALAPPVNLSGQFNFIGIADDGVAFGGGAGATQGFDHDGNSFSSTYIPPSLSSGGVSFTIGTAGQSDMFNSSVGLSLTMPSTAHYSKILLIAAAVNGSLTGQTGTFVVHYTDTTTASFTQTFSDWAYPYPTASGTTLAFNPGNQTTVISSPYRDTYTGGRQTAASIPVMGFYAFEYTFPIDNTKFLSTMMTPANANIQIMAITIVP
jgi:hypothetical protein